MILYFHGFASCAKSWKVELLKKQLTSETILAPTLPVDPAEVVQLINQVMTGKDKPDKPGLAIGSSLGGFYAYYTAARYDIPAVLINPSMTPWLTLKNLAGVHKRYYTGEGFEWKAQYLDTLAKLNDEIIHYGPKHQRLHFFLSQDDEVLDLDSIPGQFPDAGAIRFYDNCQHSFNRFEEIIPEIVNILDRKEGQVM